MRLINKRNIQQHLQDILLSMPEDKLALLVDFAEYLKSKDEWEATHELMSDAGMLKDILEGEEQAKRGEGRNWRDIKRHV